MASNRKRACVLFTPPHQNHTDCVGSRVPGGAYFFTVNLLERRLDALVRHIDLLREPVRGVRQRYLFHIGAWLPDHLHGISTLPEGDDDFSTRWWLQNRLRDKALPLIERRSAVREFGLCKWEGLRV